MSFDVNWDIDKHREDHESDEHWELRRAFIERWKNDYPEERLVCLARVFANMEFMGCRYPPEVMHEVAGLSHEIAASYRKAKKSKLQRTFVSASDAAEDRARGVKREGGVVIGATPSKAAKINFVPQGHVNDKSHTDNGPHTDANTLQDDNPVIADLNGIDETETNDRRSSEIDVNEYLKDMTNVKCVDIRYFQESMFQTIYGRMVMLVRPWASKLWNIQASCKSCNVPFASAYEGGCFSVTMGGKLVARATGISKADARSIVELLAWNRLREEMITVIVKEQWIAQGDARISVSDVTGGRRAHEFGTPLKTSVAEKMMKLMGWKGGGLGADAQGIAEPIKPNLQLVNRAGLGSTSTDIRQLRRAAQELMRRYVASDAIDLDLVFSSEFSKEERAQLHQCAQRAGLASRSYGDKDRFLVVKKKLDPFSLVRAIIEKGGNTPKYQVFIPCSLNKPNGR